MLSQSRLAHRDCNVTLGTRLCRCNHDWHITIDTSVCRCNHDWHITIDTSVCRCSHDWHIDGPAQYGRYHKIFVMVDKDMSGGESSRQLSNVKLIPNDVLRVHDCDLPGFAMNETEIEQGALVDGVRVMRWRRPALVGGVRWVG